MVVAAETPAEVGADIADEEADEAEAAPLTDVLGLVAHEVLVVGGRTTHRHD
jgi:hypothetical protein